ncbi:hypothetical protein SFK1770_3066 [Shigella flexneri K-1770]|nr:hypothetical protein SFVA6_2873 [Shigella flexneri VA-6]EIQ10713.1 hypothetical protein SFK1770_3066 [Shigella flexneri K-1770]
MSKDNNPFILMPLKLKSRHGDSGHVYYLEKLAILFINPALHA